MRKLLIPLLAAIALPTAAIEQPLLFERKSNTATEILANTEIAQVKSAVFYYNRGIDKSDVGDYYGAISDYSKAIEINPSYAKAYANRGIAKELIGDRKGACSDWRKVRSLER